MKEWQCWCLFIIAVIIIATFAIWLSMTLSVMTCYYITVICNGLVLFYVLYEFGGNKKKKR